MKTNELEIASGRRAELLLKFANQSGKGDIRPNEIITKLWGGYSEVHEITVLTFDKEKLTETQLTLIDDMIKSVSAAGGELDIINSDSGYIDIEFWGGKKLTVKSLEIVSEFLDQHTIPYYFVWRFTSTGQNIFNALT